METNRATGACAVVHPADIQDRNGAKLVLALIKHTFLRLRLIWADGGYAGQLLDWVRSLLVMIGLMIRRLAQEKGPTHLARSRRAFATCIPMR